MQMGSRNKRPNARPNLSVTQARAFIAARLPRSDWSSQFLLCMIALPRIAANRSQWSIVRVRW